MQPKALSIICFFYFTDEEMEVKFVSDQALG